MIYLYATMTKSEAYLKNGKRLNPKLDNLFLKNKIVVMDEEFYSKFSFDFDNLRIITVGKKDLSKCCDVESYKDVNSVINSFRFQTREKDLYFMGNFEFLKEVVPYVEGIIINVVDDYVENIGNIYFPNFDDYNFKVIDKTEVYPNVLRITSLRTAPYGYKKPKVNKRRKYK